MLQIISVRYADTMLLCIHFLMCLAVRAKKSVGGAVCPRLGPCCVLCDPLLRLIVDTVKLGILSVIHDVSVV